MNSVQSHVDLDGCRVADLFCGSGSLGIEALSRGAGSCVFVDADRAAIEATAANLTRTGLDHGATVVRGDVLGWLVDMAECDLVLMDPPYSFDDWATIFRALRSDWAVTESDRELGVPDGWDLRRGRRHGATWVQLLSRREADAAHAG